MNLHRYKWLATKINDAWFCSENYLLSSLFEVLKKYFLNKNYIFEYNYYQLCYEQGIVGEDDAHTPQKK